MMEMCDLFQAAYCVMLMERHLPARQVLLDELHIKFGEDPDSSITSKLEVSVYIYHIHD